MSFVPLVIAMVVLHRRLGRLITAQGVRRASALFATKLSGMCITQEFAANLPFAYCLVVCWIPDETFRFRILFAARRGCSVPESAVFEHQYA
jgi:hypothetical protein